MLSEMCAECKNYFLAKREADIHCGVFTIADGELQVVDFLKEGQYFRIVGSVYNDDIYQYPCPELVDETFDGAVWAMSVPPDFASLADRVGEWVKSNTDAISKPYNSESFGGYTYSVGSTTVSNASPFSSNTWQGHFEPELKRYRRVSIL